MSNIHSYGDEVDEMNGDALGATASFAGPIVAVLLGILVFRYQQESQQANQRFVVEGVQKLYGAISILLSAHLLNFQIANYCIRLLRTYELGDPLVPTSEEIPRFLAVDLESLPIDALLPVQDLLDDRVVLDWAMLALSDLTLEPKEADFQIRQPLAAYYRNDPATTTIKRDEAVARLSAVVDAWEARVKPHFQLLDRLYDLARHIGLKRPWKPGSYYKIGQRTEVQEMKKEWRRGLREARQAGKDAERVLKSGGADRPQS